MQVQKSKIFSSFKDIVNMPVVPLMVVVISSELNGKCFLLRKKMLENLSNLSF